MRGLLSAWGFYVAGALTVLLGLWLYARRFEFEASRPLRASEEE